MCHARLETNVLVWLFQSLCFENLSEMPHVRHWLYNRKSPELPCGSCTTLLGRPPVLGEKGPAEPLLPEEACEGGPPTPSAPACPAAGLHHVARLHSKVDCAAESCPSAWPTKPCLEQFAAQSTCVRWVPAALGSSPCCTLYSFPYRRTQGCPLALPVATPVPHSFQPSFKAPRGPA